MRFKSKKYVEPRSNTSPQTSTITFLYEVTIIIIANATFNNWNEVREAKRSIPNLSLHARCSILSSPNQ